MAQLHVQKKRNQSWWIWLIVLLIAIAVIYYIMVRNNVVPDSLGLKNYSALLINAYTNNNTV